MPEITLRQAEENKYRTQTIARNQSDVLDAIKRISKSRLSKRDKIRALQLMSNDIENALTKIAEDKPII